MSPDMTMEGQTLIGSRNARFLQLWYESYHFYDETKWIFNAETIPTEILKRRPDLVHRVYGRFGPWGPTVCPLLYSQYYDKWRTEYYAFHLLIRNKEIALKNWCFNGKPPKQTEFDEEIASQLNVTFGEMFRELHDFELGIMKSEHK